MSSNSRFCTALKPATARVDSFLRSRSFDRQRRELSLEFALPAIHRRLEELPLGAHALVIAQVQDAADERAFQSRAQLDLQWVHSDAALLAALRALHLPAGEGFAWAAGEASVITQVRSIVLDEKHVPLACTRISSYWKRGAADFHESH